MPDSRPHLRINQPRRLEDRTYTGGGGGGTYQRSSYAQHAAKVFAEAQALRTVFQQQGDADNTNRRYVRIELPEDKNLWSKEGEKIENAVLGKLVGTPQKNIGHFSTLRTSFDNLVEQMQTYRDSDDNSGKSKFAVIEGITKIPAREKISEGLYKLIDSGGYQGEALVTLFPDLTREEQETLKAAINEYLSDKDGEILADAETDFGKVFRVRTKAEDIEDLAEFFLSIQTVDPIEEALVESATAGERIEDTVTVAVNTSTARVCIFDTGVVRGSRFIDHSIVEREEPLGPPLDVDHGTFVASRIIYGHSFRDDVSVGTVQPDVKVLSVCMVSRDEIGNPRPAKGEEFLKIIRDTVRRWYQTIKVFNLSMNLVYQNSETAAVVTDDHVGAVAAEIDKLSRQYKVLFVLTTGNYPISPLTPPPTEPYPRYFTRDDNRLCRPGESMLALTVGSVTDREDGGSMARTNSPSPFTRRGPGFNGYRKPDLVAHGGNYAANWRPYNDLSVVAIGRDGDRLAYGNGTSYAAPLVSRLASHVFDRIPTATPDLVRALLIHSADDIDQHGLDDETFRLLVGNGLPSAERILNSDRWHQSYTFQGTIGYRKIMKIPFYVPEALTGRTGRKRVRVRFTMVFSPETNRTLKRGYCKSHLQTQLSKLNEAGELVPVPAGDSAEVVNDRYSTVIRYDKVFSDGITAGEWELVVEQKSKWTLSETDTPFAVVVTVCDPRKDADIDIHNLITTAVPNRYESLVQVQQQIRI